MDPLTQGVLGTVTSQQLANKKTLLTASLLGFLSGMSPDLDIFIRSSSDPLLALEYHRQFTHSLIFIPVGGLICATFFFFLLRFAFKKSSLSFKQSYLYCTLGYSTHALLDACTTYGTQLFWPFSDMRVAWNTISIIDPLFTLPLLALVVLAVYKRCRRLSLAALCWLVIYSGLGVIQRERAEAAGLELANQRGHQPITLEAKPSFANIFVWKIVYTTEHDYYVDAVRVAGDITFYPGDSIKKLDISRDFPWLDVRSQQAKDVERFRWFSNGYLAVSPIYPNRIIDIRYSLIPNEIKGMWGIELNEQAGDDQHINYVTDHKRDNTTFKRLWRMIVGE